MLRLTMKITQRHLRYCLGAILASFLFGLFFLVSDLTKVVPSGIKYEYVRVEKARDYKRQPYQDLLTEGKIPFDKVLDYRKQVYTTHYRRITNNNVINCLKIVEGAQDELARAKELMMYSRGNRITPERYIKKAEDCEVFKETRGYIDHPLSQTELEFPLAFSIMVHTNIEQAERLLRAIYRPQNYYCIHVDSKLEAQSVKALKAIVNCFNNVFIADQSLNVTWGTYSVLEIELICMKHLWEYTKWIYYINLTGQEFPLKTNREIVAILQAMGGANIVDGTFIRAKKKYRERWTSAGRPPPHHIIPIKGSVHVAVNRHFVDFVLHDKRSLDFLEWLKQTEIPDETFFASLNHNPHLGIIGSFLGEAEEYPLKPFFLRYKNWEIDHSVYVRKCAGTYVRNICVLGVGDLHRAYNDVGLFANKLYLYFEPIALDCIEEVMYDKTWKQYVEDVPIDVEYYKHLDYAHKKLT